MSYIITPKTLLLESKNNKTKIYEENETFIINENITDIINYNCLLNGSTLEGRQKASAFLLGNRYKPPIILNINTILIPTHSITNNSCIWLVLNNIRNYKKYQKGTLIEFLNQKTLILKTSFNIFDNQVLKGTRLESALRGRNNKKYF